MIYTKMTKEAMRVAYKAHHGQVDKTDIPYIMHPLHLAEQMTDEVSTTCALLHDVVEDTFLELDDLRNMGFPEEVVHIVGLLTHDEDLSYDEYINRLKNHPIARKIKIADMIHNSNLDRWDTDKKDGIRIKNKYANYIVELTKIEEEYQKKRD